MDILYPIVVLPIFVLLCPFWSWIMTDYSWCFNAFLSSPKVDVRSCKRYSILYIYMVFPSLLPFLLLQVNLFLLFLLQVGYVTTICFSCFLIRCVMVSPHFLINLSDPCCLVLKWVWSHFTLTDVLRCIW